MTGFTERDLASFKNVVAILKKMTLPSANIMECGSTWFTLKWAEESIQAAIQEMKLQKANAEAMAALASAQPILHPSSTQAGFKADPVKSKPKAKKK